MNENPQPRSPESAAHYSIRLSFESGAGTIGAFSPVAERKLMTSVRRAHQLGLEPILVLVHADFMVLLDYWPQFYLTGPVVITRTRSTFYSWLRRLLVRRKRTPPSLSVQFSDEALNGIREQMLRKQAVPVDGIWVPVGITVEQSQETTNDTK